MGTQASRPHGSARARFPLPSSSPNLGAPWEPTIPWSFYSLARVDGKEPGFGVRPALNLASAFI